MADPCATSLILGQSIGVVNDTSLPTDGTRKDDAPTSFLNCSIYVRVIARERQAQLEVNSTGGSTCCARPALSNSTASAS